MMYFLRFALMFVVVFRLISVSTRLIPAFRKEPLRIGEESCYFDVERSKSGHFSEIVVAVAVPDTARFAIYTETGIDRLAKSLGLAHEWQTNDAEFDRRMFILSDDAVLLRQLSDNESLRRAISDLWGAESGGPLRCSRGYLSIVATKLPDKNLEDAVAARIVAERMLPALTRVKAEIATIAAGPWRAERMLDSNGRRFSRGSRV